MNEPFRGIDIGITTGLEIYVFDNDPGSFDDSEYQFICVIIAIE